MPRPVFILILLLSNTLFPTLASASAEKPNLVLILIDDMGYGDIGPFGSKINRTPHLDRMAAEGMKLTSFYAAPVCSASRAQLMTGSYAPRVSVPGVFFPAGKNGLNPEEHTVADYLRESGYATMCVGKWHLGDQRQLGEGRNPDPQPRRRDTGHQESPGLLQSHPQEDLCIGHDDKNPVDPDSPRSKFKGQITRAGVALK